MYAIRILDAAIKDLKRLDKPVARDVVARVNWMAENFDIIEHKVLKGDLAGYYKFRAGDYRIIYEIFEKVFYRT